MQLEVVGLFPLLSVSLPCPPRTLILFWDSGDI